MSDTVLPSREATLADAPAIAALLAATIPDPWNATVIAQALASNARALLAESSGGALAALVLFQAHPPEAEILQIAVEPALRSRGIGKRLLREGLGACARLGALEIFLEVRPGNAAALALYEACGFRQVGRRRQYYSNGEDALLMRLDVRLPAPSG